MTSNLFQRKKKKDQPSIVKSNQIYVEWGLPEEHKDIDCQPEGQTRASSTGLSPHPLFEKNESNDGVRIIVRNLIVDHAYS
jgi:hypothetical protein